MSTSYIYIYIVAEDARDLVVAAREPLELGGGLLGFLAAGLHVVAEHADDSFLVIDLISLGLFTRPRCRRRSWERER